MNTKERIVEVLDSTIYRRFGMQNKQMNDNDINELAD